MYSFEKSEGLQIKKPSIKRVLIVIGVLIVVLCVGFTLYTIFINGLEKIKDTAYATGQKDLNNQILNQFNQQGYLLFNYPKEDGTSVKIKLIPEQLCPETGCECEQ